MAPTHPHHGEMISQTPCNLFGLTLELQIIIYKYALHDPILWDRRHRDGCNLRPTEEGVVEHPPWIWHRPIVDAVLTQVTNQDGTRSYSRKNPVTYKLLNTWKFCDCAKRAGINLLRANRRIFQVAAPLFWSSGTFCFFDAAEFAACMRVTSPVTRAMIRGVSISSFQCSRVHDMRVYLRLRGRTTHGSANDDYTWSMAKPAFWSATKLLPGLEHLAIPWNFLNPIVNGSYRSEDTALPQLKCLELTGMAFLGGTSATEKHLDTNRVAFWTALYRNEGWASFAVWSQRFDMRVPVDTMWKAAQALETEYQIKHRICTDLLTAGPKMLGDGSLQLAPHADLVGGCKTMAVQLRNGMRLGPKIDVTFYCLPLDKDACARSRLAIPNAPQESEPSILGLQKTLWGRDETRFTCIRYFEDLFTGKTPYPTTRVDQGHQLGLPCHPDAARQGKQQQYREKRIRVKKNRRGYKRRG